MLKHHHINALNPHRVVVLGANGFVGKATVARLQRENIAVLPLARQHIDLLQPTATSDLSQRLLPNDALVVIAAQAPCKNIDMLANNIVMMQAICQALEKQPVKHVIYISSDAVYADCAERLTENSITMPGSLHGMMHVTREMMLQSVVKSPLAILRPSLLYGECDPHNGYGPNQFRRLAIKGEPIVLFGEGEEERDHVFIDDVAELIYLTLVHQSAGILNIVTGEVTSFRKIAQMTNALVDKPVAIQSRSRSGPMPHRGFRPFDNTATDRAFPHFRYTSLSRGLALSMHQPEVTV
ncbi:MAG: NAD-dependent dehydratase [Coxiella sp. RIFCSPHIGHO2_12_FULL_42_15]|nr:MAG: NAD-dependent dehydratase [Coxiella sp. RIFCSPHIGHO2_12_FULL_42_15]